MSHLSYLSKVIMGGKCYPLSDAQVPANKPSLVGNVYHRSAEDYYHQREWTSNMHRPGTCSGVVQNSLFTIKGTNISLATIGTEICYSTNLLFLTNMLILALFLVPCYLACQSIHQAVELYFLPLFYPQIMLAKCGES